MQKLILGASLIFIAVLSRLLPHPPNVVPIAAMALAGGVYFERRYALIIPMIALFVSDCIIGFHATIPFVYGCFLITGLIGMWLSNHKKIGYIAGGTILSSIIFFVITNFGVWLTGGGWFYPKTLQGLVDCYVMAIPFFRYSIAGDLAYTSILFGLFELSIYALQLSKKKTAKI